MNIQLRHETGEARVDSRELALALHNQHENVLSLLSDYAEDFTRHGILRFETGKTQGRGRPPKYALLNEDHALLLLTLVRPSEHTTPLKSALVAAFGAARRALAAPPVSSPLLLARQMLAALEDQEARVHALETRLDEQPVRVNSAMRAQLHAAGQAFGKIHPKGFRGAWSAFKEAFGAPGTPLAAYDDLPTTRLDEALEWFRLQQQTYANSNPRIL